MGYSDLFYIDIQRNQLFPCRMGKILDAFVDDQLHVNAVIEKRTKHHQHLCEQVEVLHDKLEKRLNDEDRELLQKFADTYFDESCCDAHNSFVGVTGWAFL